jgi:hypothetical protein
MPTDALMKSPPAYLQELETLETEVAATRYGAMIKQQELERKLADERKGLELRQVEARQVATLQRNHKLEHWATEGLQVLASLGAGALANATIGGFPVGSTINFVAGSVCKLAALSEVESTPLRVVANAGKTLLHTQIGISTRDILRGMP